MCACLDQSLRGIESGHAGIGTDLHAKPADRANRLILWNSRFDRIEIGDVDLLNAECLAIDVGQRQWVAVDGLSRGVRNRRIRLSMAAAGMNRLTFFQIDDADDSHRRYSVPMILGWDIGGVNTKVARLDESGAVIARSRPFELQREPDALVRVLIALAAEVGAAADDGFACAVTMTAELSQMFRTKRDGVTFVLDAVAAAFPAADVRVFTTNGSFVHIDEARKQPLAVAAANWAATAKLVSRRYPTALLVDAGTTTTDIIPIVDGQVVAAGTTDPARLASGELVYSGALRTPVEAVVRDVPFREGRAAVSAEGFALIGDVHLWRGHLAAEDYTVPTPDGRAASREFAGERIARIICADSELLDESDISRIAESVAAEQIATIAAALSRVRSHHPSLQCAVVTGLGEFIARDAAQAAGFDVISLAGEIGDGAARYAPAAAVAMLCAEGPAESGHHVGGPAKAGPYERSVALVVKVGGGLLQHVEHLDRVLAAISDVARTTTVVVVPGGGAFADVVRDVDARFGLGDDAAHWMAILGMDQYAHLLASRLNPGVVVATTEEIRAAQRTGRIPVLAPSRWLMSIDPLPHTWDVTSDSIAAWIAAQLRAAELLLVKPPGAGGADLVDPHFDQVARTDVPHQCLEADRAIDVLNQMACDAKGAEAALSIRSR